MFYCLCSWYSICWWRVSCEISVGQRFSADTAEGLLSYENLSSECRIEWGNLREHIEKGLEARFGYQTYIVGKKSHLFSVHKAIKFGRF